VITSPGPGVIDVHGLLVRELRDNDDLADLVGARIYARKYPERVTLPALRINYPNADAMAQPTLQWFTYDGQVDVHADTHIQGSAIAAVLQTALIALENATYPEGVVSTVEPFGVRSGFDAEWTPPKPHWIVSARIRASGP
jgi:hypothetical protein